MRKEQKILEEWIFNIDVTGVSTVQIPVRYYQKEEYNFSWEGEFITHRVRAWICLNALIIILFILSIQL